MVWLALFLPVATAAEAPPNVLLVTIDTLRADRVGCYGYGKIQTPHMDGLAAEGVRFARAYTPVPITLPAHAVLFTGTYPTWTGMHDFSGNRLAADHPTLAALLREKGYRTAGIVGSAVLDSRFGLNRGFDFYYDNFDFSRLDETNLDAMERPGNEVVDQALAWLGQNHDQPFFLWVHLYEPHHPYQPPPPYAAQYASQPYDGEVAFADAQLGRLLGFLREKKLSDRTLIAVTSDHGEGLGEHNEKTHGFFIYTTTLHVPLILKLPAGQTATRKRVDAPVSLADLLPTILELVEVPVPRSVQGRSLLPLWRGRAAPGREGLYAETFLPRIHFNWSELRSVRVGDYHFIDAPKPELYDLAKDPRERKNLYPEKRTVANELRDRLGRLIKRYSPPAGEERTETTALDPALMERLKSLGYVAVSAGGDPTISNRDLPDPKDRIEMYELISEAIAESQRRRYPASTAKLEAALKIEQDSLPVHYLLALNYYRQRDFPRAIAEFQQVLRLQPDYSLAVYYLGLSYGQAGEIDQAIAAFEKALTLDGTNFSAAFNLGAAYLKKGRLAESVAAFEQALAIYPDYVPAYKALGEVWLYQGQLDEAIAALRKAVSLAPNDAAAHRTLAKALEAKGLHEEAAEHLRKAQPGPQP